MQLREFKIRCSAIGKIMTEPRAKSEKLSETCKSYLQEWVKEQIYNTKKEIKSKYLEKGIGVELDSIDYYSYCKNLGFVLKNENHFENDFMTGTPDLILPDQVVDIKSSWDCFTFPLFDNSIDKGYELQLQGYMALTGKRKATLAYVLINTPEELEWNETVDYSELSSEYRIKEYSIDYNPELIEKINQRVIECREYISNLQIK